MRRGLFLWVLVAAALSHSRAHAGKTKVWHHSAPAHHEKSKLQGAVLNNEGAVHLARQLKPLADIDATHVWGVVEAKNGDLIVATGDEGRIYRVTSGGAISIALQTEDSEVLCLAQSDDGTVYAGTGPKGRVYRIDSNGEGRMHCEIPESYVWSLALDPKTDALYAGTGSKGRIYKVAPDGSASVFCATKQDHVLALAMDANGMLFAGTDKNGLVYRVDENGKGFVLYHASQPEVRCLVVGPTGIYAGTSSPRRREIGARPLVDRSSNNGAPAVLTSNRSSVHSSTGNTSEEAAGTTRDAKTEGKKGTPAPSTPAAVPGENSIYRISADATGRELLREKAMILSMAVHGERLYVGTGGEGQLLECNERTKQCSELARLDHGHIHCICRRRDGSFVIGTGDPGKLYVLKDEFTARANLLSAVLDAKVISRWGALRWQADVPAETHVTLAVRSGNLPDPDETWSDWSAEQSDPETALIHAPTARYLQYRVTLTTKNPEVTPTVRNVTLRYCPHNQAPEVETLEIPNLDAVNIDSGKKIRIKWTATDPNEDELTYQLLIRKDGWGEWVCLEENFEKREYEWDTTTAPTGTYQVKVVAGDRKDNASEHALTGERVSLAFPVAHVPPSVAVNVMGIEGRRVTVEASAEDVLVRLTSAAYALDGKQWTNVFPSDGFFDRKTARFRFTTEALEPGTHVLVLKVRDAAGNTGSGDAVLTIPK